MEETTRKRTNRDEPLGISLPNGRSVRAHITGPAQDAGGLLSVRWEVVSAGGKHVVTRSATARTHIYDPRHETWAHAISTMIDRAKNAFYKEYRPESPDHVFPGSAGASDGPYCSALNSLTDEELGEMRSTAWRSDRTWAQHLSYLRRICEELDRQLAGALPEGRLLDIEVLRAVREALIAEIKKSKRTKSVHTAAKTADKELRAVDFCLAILCEKVNNRYGHIILPFAPLAWVCMPGAVPTDYEQVKWIPMRVLCRMIHLCFRLISNGLVMGVMLMLCLGLRTSEACAVRIGDLIRLENGVMYKVRTQGADRNPRLKTVRAYRSTFAGKLLYDMVEALVEHLRSLGFSDEEILRMPAVSLPGRPMQPADSSALSEFARKLLFKAGYLQEDYQRAVQLMLIEPDYESDGKTPIQSVAAYIFRRCAATLLLTVCDLYPMSSIADEYLGHVSHDPRRTEYDNPSFVQETLIPRMERLVLHPDHSANPLYCPILLQNGIHDFSEYAAASFRAVEETDVKFILETTEPNQEIVLNTDAAFTLSCIRRTLGKEEEAEHRAAHPIIPLPPSPEEFRAFLSGIDDVDISDLLPPHAGV